MRASPRFLVALLILGTVLFGAASASACTPGSTARAVTICSPTSTSGSSIHVSAAAKSTTAIKGMGIWLDGVKMYQAYSNTVDTSFSASAGAHRVTVAAADSSGTFYADAYTTVSTTTLPTWTISGAISPAASGVAISIGGAKSASTTTNASGTYSFSGLANGLYSITPTRSGYTFSPAGKSVTVNGANISGVNFTASVTTAQTWTITGAVSPATSGVAVSLSGTKSGSTTTNSSGAYSFSGLSSGSYTVQPTLSGLTFTPTSKSVSVNGGSVSGVNFTGTTTSSGHSVSLSWAASSSSSVSGYKVYRSNISGGPYALLNSAPVTSTIYSDLNVASGTTYYYVVAAVDSAGNQSGYSNQSAAVVPTP